MGIKRKSKSLDRSQEPSLSSKKLNISAGQEDFGSRLDVASVTAFTLNSSSIDFKSVRSITNNFGDIHLIQKPEAYSCPTLSHYTTSGLDRQISSPGPLSLTRQTLRKYNEANGFSHRSSSMGSDSNSNATGSRLANAEEAKDVSDPKEPKGAINANHPDYTDALESAGVCFAGRSTEKPSNYDALTRALYALRAGPDPDDDIADIYYDETRESVTETEFCRAALPWLVPTRELSQDKKICVAYDISWSRDVMLDANIDQKLTTLKPDMTIGWYKQTFGLTRALRALLRWACPVSTKPKLTFPLFTIEAKGRSGTLEASSSQNLHNAATMLSNLLYLKKKCGKSGDDSFFNRVHVLTAEITTETVQLSCYWATRSESEGVKYYGMRLASWSPAERCHFKEAHRCLRNAMDWVRKEAFDWVTSDLMCITAGEANPPCPPATPRPASTPAATGRTRRLSDLSGNAAKRPRLQAAKPLA